MQNKDKISELVRSLRKSADLSQIQLAEMAGVSRTAVQHLEAGKLTIQLDTLLKIFSILNITILFDHPMKGAS